MASPPEQDSPPSDSPDSPPPQPSSTPSPPPPSPSSPSPPPPSSPPPSSPPPPSSSPPPSSPPPSPNNSPPPPPPNDNHDNSPPPPPPPTGGTFSPPPPPPSKTRSPPPPKSLGPSSSKNHHGESKDSDSSGGGGGSSNIVPIAAGVAAGVVVFFLIALLAYMCTCRKKKKRSGKDYYPDPYPQGSKNSYYGLQVPQAPSNSWQNGGSILSPSSLPPPPGGWGQQPPPPPPPITGMTMPPMGMTSSSEFSSNYSGPQGPALPPPHPSVALGFTKSSFSYEELALATNGFSQANLLGQGGFGYVHKGVLPNGKEIAVKSLKAGSGQGDREFQAEVEIISRVHHRHLVSLVGYCIASGQKLLVYEYLPNFTLDHHLHGKGHPVMDWPKRMKIALGSAKGLAYLHEDCHPKIIHRDIKGSNILLDYNYEAKVADFGLAKLSTDTNTHVSTRVMGTFGYLAPEYAASGKLTEKSDVFSFGVMLLELITGRRPIDLNTDMEDSLVDWARPLCERALEDGDYSKLADPLMEGQYDPQEMARMVACASASIRHSARKRPKMSQIVRAIEGDLSVEHMKDGTGITTSQSQSSLHYSAEDYDINSYGTNMRNLRKKAMESTEYASSEFGQTSEYGLNPSSSSSEENSRNYTRHSP